MGEWYYTLLFILFAFIQDEVKGIASSLICFSMSYFSEGFFNYFSNIGIGFFETAIIYDMIFMFISIFLINTKSGMMLFAVTFFSMLFNIVGYNLKNPVYYSYYVKNYSIINIILFEILLYTCFVTTIVYPWLKTKINDISIKR